MTKSRHVVPASFFGMVLGMSGLGNGWRAASRIWGAPAWIGETLLLLTGAVWLALVAAYAWKWLFAREAAKAELRDPVLCCYVGLIFVATLLMAIAVLPYSRAVAMGLAVIGWAGSVAFGAWTTGGLWRGVRSTEATTAVLYLPTVAGNLVGAMAAGALGYSALGNLFFGAGLLSWFAIESVLMHRLYTDEPLPLSQRTSLGIQLAPPVVSCVAYLSVNGNVPDLFAQIMFGYGLLQAVVMIRLIPWLREHPFAPGYWAFSFGVAALALSALRMVLGGIQGPVAVLAAPLFAAANLIIGTFMVRTFRLLVTGRLLSAQAGPADEIALVSVEESEVAKASPG